MNVRDVSVTKDKLRVLTIYYYVFLMQKFSTLIEKGKNNFNIL